MKYADLRRENDLLRNALESLVDLQNGPPLLKYAEEWELAMWAARRALGRPDHTDSARAQDGSAT